MSTLHLTDEMRTSIVYYNNDKRIYIRWRRTQSQLQMDTTKHNVHLYDLAVQILYISNFY